MTDLTGADIETIGRIIAKYGSQIMCECDEDIYRAGLAAGNKERDQMQRVIDAAKAMDEQAGPCGYCNGAGWYVVVRPHVQTGEAEECQEQCANCAARQAFAAAIRALKDVTNDDVR